MFSEKKERASCERCADFYYLLSFLLSNWEGNVEVVEIKFLFDQRNVRGGGVKLNCTR